ncbi:MAG: 4-hydroxy-tetrahydrodipicolinate reductase [Inconstantimicrobium porci]|uniref:4-hydroxy-tetrahydrodipicolinate reductase n=1 Tax=Inconstantimicrobium porci TaxID=2652291 RepID=A0A7X2SZZ3_9CLOT|nr:4-hydroxy-tetrahydrodipicolinate reductase [Inconstantimicrobium porci]MDD6770940.1 4-hydroxy-tetrahydrodipicolinate reductase [Inconstantimicrobium porci]MDY5912332.1 4-hydroxy-tetrahydrodipicolinate reductase [Inconstantimicrobium porci]MSR89969.1 4-hydroxy-tetrahydrodipicolinate reductase [Inconstantimicrobium porci]
MIKILLHGCCGKMGKVVSNLTEKYDNLEITAGVDKFGTNDMKYPVFKSLEECTSDYDVMIDFSRADALEGLLNFSLKNKKPIILCSTGYSNEQLKLLDETSKKLPIFRSANMSVGINLMNMLLRKVAPILNDSYDIEIIEEHHNQKVDSPSGTAIMLADSIKNSIDTDANYVYGRSGHKKREKHDIGIHAIRGGSIVGNHDVIFAGEGEVIKFTHNALSRDLFAVGALKAAIYMAKVTENGLYNMEDVIGLVF